MSGVWTAAAFAVLGGAIIWLAARLGGESARLDALRAELNRREREKQYADKVLDGVMRMDKPAVRRRMRKLADKK